MLAVVNHVLENISNWFIVPPDYFDTSLKINLKSFEIFVVSFVQFKTVRRKQNLATAIGIQK